MNIKVGDMVIRASKAGQYNRGDIRHVTKVKVDRATVHWTKTLFGDAIDITTIVSTTILLVIKNEEEANEWLLKIL